MADITVAQTVPAKQIPKEVQEQLNFEIEKSDILVRKVAPEMCAK